MAFPSLRRLFLIPLLLLGLSAAAPLDDDLGTVGDFTLTERSGRTISKSDLLGKVWIASFEFTRCTAGCPQISATMERLQTDLSRLPRCPPRHLHRRSGARSSRGIARIRRPLSRRSASAGCS